MGHPPPSITGFLPSDLDLENNFAKMKTDVIACKFHINTKDKTPKTNALAAAVLLKPDPHITETHSVTFAWEDMCENSKKSSSRSH